MNYKYEKVTMETPEQVVGNQLEGVVFYNSLGLEMDVLNIPSGMLSEIIRKENIYRRVSITG